MSQSDREILRRLFAAAVAAADPLTALRPHLPEPPKGRLVVIGAGKGAAQLAQAFEQLWPGPLTGVVVTRHGFAVPCARIRVIEAAHPVPDSAGLSASAALIAAVSGLTADDLVVALICGGGSALLPAPAPGLTFEDEVALNRALLASGAPIGVMNAIRKQVSTIKGGRLAVAAHPARVLSLIVSDVPGDQPSQIASGPTVADQVTRAEVRDLIAAWRIELPPAIADFIAGEDNPAPLPDDPRLAGSETRIIASARQSLDAAAALAPDFGLTAHILSDAIEGEAREVARVHAAIAREVALRDRPFARPALILSGGETTVTLPKDAEDARGGRNGEFALSLALAAEGLTMAALAADTDGVDGSEDNAGAFVDGGTAARLRAFGHDPARMLAGHQSWQAFDALGDLFVTGPTGTNVNDFRAMILRQAPDHRTLALDLGRGSAHLPARQCEESAMDLEAIRSGGLVLLGCGKMGSAMLAGWLDRGVPAAAVHVIEPHPSDWLAAQGVHLNAALPAAPAVVVVAVKPQMMAAALPAITGLGGGATLVLSIAAGTTIATYEAAFGPATPVVRAMPNTPAAIGRGITAMIGNAGASAAQLDLAEALLSAVGQVVRLETEGQIDAVTAVSGSGPAYVFHLIETLAAAAEAEGLAPDLALRLARATVAGSGALAEASAEDPGQLRRNVTSPNGTTQAALEVLMDPGRGFPALVPEAVHRARLRSEELARG